MTDLSISIVLGDTEHVRLTDDSHLRQEGIQALRSAVGSYRKGVTRLKEA
jgi:hypothetical protein